MPVSVDQPNVLKVSSVAGDVISVTIVKTGSTTKFVSVTPTVTNNISIAGAIGAGPAGATGAQGPQGETGATGPQGEQGPAGTVEALGEIPDVSLTTETSGQVLQYDGTNWVNADLVSDANNVTQTVKNMSGGELVKGTPVHAITEANPQGQLAYVIAARADTASAMPATFVLNETLADEAEGEALVVGLINNVDTSAFTAGDVVYVGETGGYTNVKPTGDNLIQNLGVVIKSHATSGSGMVYGSGRSNDVPNLPSGKFFIGSSGNTAESAYTLPTSDGTAGQALVTDGSGAVTFEDIGGGAIESAITISNLDAAFSHMTTPISAGTSIESILRDMLEKYNTSTINFTAIHYALETTTPGVYGSYSYSTNGVTVDVGRGIKVDGFQYSVSNPSQTTDNSVTFYDANTPVQTGYSDTGTTGTLSSVITDTANSPAGESFKLSVVDSGSGQNVTVYSSSKVNYWRYRLRAGASTTDTISSSTDAGNLWSGMSLAYNQLGLKTTFSFSATTQMDTSGYYTWIAYPSSFGNLSSVLLDGNTNVLSDFESPVDYNITNDYGVTTSYRFYRSTYDNAFSSSSPTQVLTIEF